MTIFLQFQLEFFYQFRIFAVTSKNFTDTAANVTHKNLRPIQTIGEINKFPIQPHIDYIYEN